MSDFDLMVDMPNAACWPRKSADSLCSLISRGNAPVYVEKSEIRAIGQRCVSAKGFIEKHVRPHSESAVNGALQPESGDVLLNSTGTGTIGRSVVFSSPGRFIVDGHVTVMRPRPGIADARWLNAVLQAPFSQRHLERFCYAGSTNQLELSRTPLRLSHFPAPSFEEQERIGQVIDTLDAAIHGTEALIAKLKAVKQGLLHDLMTRGIDANGELRPPQCEAPHLYKSSPLGWIPLEWETPSFSELQSHPVLGTGVRGAIPEADNYRLLKMGNLKANNEFDLRSVERVAISRVPQAERLVLRDGDLLFNTRNTPELVGKTCSWREMGGEHIFDNNILRARIPSHVGSGHFFSDYLGSEIGRQHIRRLATGTTSVAAIYWKDLKDMRVPAPPVHEQRFIHSIIDQNDEDRFVAGQAANVLRELKSGLMDDLLTGRVRVTPLLEAATA